MFSCAMGTYNFERMHVLVFSILVMFILIQSATCEEPSCSRFDYEEKLLSKVIRLEIALEGMSKKYSALEESIRNLEKSSGQSGNSLDGTNSKTLAKSQTSTMLPNADGIETDSDYVAFTAKLGDHMTGLGNQQTIVFERIQTNVGNAYSPNTGVFTAPFDGLYFITATIMSHNGDYIETEIVVNGNNVVFMYSSDTKYEQGTNSAVLSLNENDEVWVRHRNELGDRVHGSSWSTFSGFLLHRG